MNKLEELYHGRLKSLYVTDNPERYIMYFRDNENSFIGQKSIDDLQNKSVKRIGNTNNRLNFYLMTLLENEGISTQIVNILNDNETIVKKLDMFPVSCVVRNYVAGKFAKNLALEEGLELRIPIFEFHYKSETLDHPMVNESHITSLGLATKAQSEKMQELSLKINKILKNLFENAGLVLVDYKLEFGVCEGQIVLGDDLSPANCHIWEKSVLDNIKNGKFSFGMGAFVEDYENVAKRIGCPLK